MHITRLLSIIILVLLSGCAGFPHQTTEQKAQLFAQRHEYAKALNLLKLPAPDHPNHVDIQSRREQILSQAAQYETQIITEAASEAAQGKWSNVFTQYDLALSRLPPSEELQSNRAKLWAEYQRQKSQLEFELMITRAQWLKQSLELVQSNYQLDISGDLAQQAAQWRTEADRLVEQLTIHGNAALIAKNIPLAQRIIPLALQLSNNTQLQQANSHLQELIEQEDQQRRAIRAQRELQQREQQILQEQQRREREMRTLQEQQQRQFREAQEECERALSSNNLVRAQQLVERMTQLNKDHERLPMLRVRLEQAVTTTIKKHHDLGMTLYSRGAFEQAITQWRQVLALDPLNEQAARNISRTEQVLLRLQQLRRKQH